MINPPPAADVIADLTDRFGDVPGVRFVADPDPLVRIDVDGPAATGSVYTHGAHVTAWTPKLDPPTQPVLFMSEKSWLAPGQPIRGGVPICFPWFGPKESDPEAPSHGFARLLPWKVQSIDTVEDGAIEIDLVLHSSEATLEAWPFDFELHHRVRFSQKLSMTLTTINKDKTSLICQQALHTYLAVSDIRNVTVAGLEAARYLDKTDRSSAAGPDKEPIRFTGETDRIYVRTRDATQVVDAGGPGGEGARQIHIEKQGSRNTVVWNPWIDKAARMPDFGDDEWPRMLCVETAAVADSPLSLDPDESHQMAAVISVAR